MARRKLTRKQIQAALDAHGRNRYAIIEAAINAMKAREYPRNSRGWSAYRPYAIKNCPVAPLSAWRAAYTLAAASLAR